MTERKPRDMSIPTWIDKQIQDATERGAFDNLPGTGKPLRNRGAFSAEAWVHDYLDREGIPGEDALPTPLRLRRESERLGETVHLLRTEQEVRDVVADLNDRIRTFRRLPDGPPVIVRLVDEDEMLRRWRETRAATPAVGLATFAAPAVGSASATCAATAGSASAAATGSGAAASADHAVPGSDASATPEIAAAGDQPAPRRRFPWFRTRLSGQRQDSGSCPSLRIRSGWLARGARHCPGNQRLSRGADRDPAQRASKK